MNSKKLAIGIDLGTSRTVMAVYYSDKTISTIKAEGNDKFIPSIVARKDGMMIVGGPAERQALSNSENTIRSVKTRMGKTKEELVKDNLPTEIKLENKIFTPEEISAQILSKAKSILEQRLNQTISDVVITVPAYFNDSQRKATQDAAEIAGLKCIRIINEPTAACLAYSVQTKLNTNANGFLVAYDLGGGTFDVSILDVQSGLYQVICSEGNTRLGGDDFDNKLVDILLQKFANENKLNITQLKQQLTPKASQRIYEAAKKMKEEQLSDTAIAYGEIELNFFFGDKDLKCQVTREEYEFAIKGYVDETIKLTQKAMKTAKIQLADVNRVIVVGGSTRTLSVRKALLDTFGVDKVDFTVDPDEIVAQGAAIQAAIIGKVGEDITNTAGDSILFIDSTPFNLGLSVEDGSLVPVINANETIPCKNSKTFTNAQDNQPHATIEIFQGNRLMAKDNKKLGEFVIDLEPKPANTNQIEVTFNLDMNQVLHVTAKDLSLNRTNSITIQDGANLSEQEKTQMKKDLEENAEKDAAKKVYLDKYARIHSIQNTIIDQIKNHQHFAQLSEEDKNAFNDISRRIHDLYSNEDLLTGIPMEEFNKEIIEKSAKLNEINNKLSNISSSKSDTDDATSSNTNTEDEQVPSSQTQEDSSDK